MHTTPARAGGGRGFAEHIGEGGRRSRVHTPSSLSAALHWKRCYRTTWHPSAAQPPFVRSVRFPQARLVQTARRTFLVSCMASTSCSMASTRLFAEASLSPMWFLRSNAMSFASAEIASFSATCSH